MFNYKRKESFQIFFEKVKNPHNLAYSRLLPVDKVIDALKQTNGRSHYFWPYYEGYEDLITNS